ncbi:6-phosphogluconolactonase [Nocardioides aestuarii]|uniref:6-phosphogluconolactonase n=1 Tax=Nocardioides aestuarii TaxID=252231 RepID=A0ABW4TUX3_9ACTN
MSAADQVEVEVHPDAATLATSVAGEVVRRIEDAQARGEVPQVGLTGGSIAVRIHAEIGRIGPESEVDWSQVVFWWGDERYVDRDSDDRNARSARSGFLDALGVDPARVHEAPALDSGLSLDDAAAAYGQEVREHGAGAFEVLMLGVGPDGHVASLFPGHPALAVDDAVAVGVPDSPKPPPGRITLTFPALRRSRAVFFVVSGEEKAEAVARALAPDGTVEETPARGVVDPGADSPTQAIWFLDRPAASLL